MRTNIPPGEAAAILSQSPDALIAIAPDGTVRSWLGAAERLFGWTANDVVGHPIDRFLDSGDAHERAAAFPARCRCKDGAVRPVDARARPVQVGDAPAEVVVALRPVEPSPLHEHFEAAPDAMVVVDASGRIERVNEGVVRLFGHAPHELVGQPVDVLVPALKAPEGGARTLRRRDGSAFPAEISRSEAGGGEILAVRDVSQRLARMSHDLRSPLNAVIGFAKIMHGGLAGPTSDQQREYLADILASADQLLQLIDGVQAKADGPP